MLSQIHIKNYALIDELHVQFHDGLTTITGETGAGKSILLGGLSLVLGKRADFSNIKDKTRKSVIECEFQIESYQLNSFFDANDLDYEAETIIRREILPSGKSRAFVNDSPVNLSVLEALGQQLIDIHSQHDTLSLTNNSFQFQIIDALAGNKALLKQFGEELKDFNTNANNLQRLMDQRQQLKNNHDYNSFLLKELEESKILDLDLNLLESEYATLSNVEFIQSELSGAQQILGAEDMGINTNMMELKQRFQQLESLSITFKELSNRIESTAIELEDIFDEIYTQYEAMEINPQRLQLIDNQLKLIQNFFNKHNVSTMDDLNQVYTSLQQKTVSIDDLEVQITEVENLLKKNQKKLNKISTILTQNRQSVLPNLQHELHAILKSLGMPQAEFKISISSAQEFLHNGKDQLSFLLKANKGGSFLPLGKGASGGELSRMMLAIKYILSKHQHLPTIMFDEIDTGVSGEISNKMASMMQDMGRYMQVFAITHLPQIAAKGEHHFKVFKAESKVDTVTQISLLSSEERLVEIAQMLGGNNISKSAKDHAQQLLN